jgi:hypothetical protein
MILVTLLAATTPLEAGQYSGTRGYTGSGGSYQMAPRASYRSGHGSTYGAIRDYGRYQHQYPAYAVYPAYPVYPVYPANSYRRHPGPTYNPYERFGWRPSTHNYGSYDSGQRRKCFSSCSDRRNSNPDYQRGYRDGYQDGHRERHGHGNDDRRCEGSDC